MRKISFIAALLLLLASATFVMAGARGKGARMGSGSGMIGPGLSGLNLTTEQSEKILALREAHMKDMIPLRTQLFNKRAELRLLWMQTNTDPEKIKAKQREMIDLMGQLQEKKTDFRLALRDILTPEQLSQFLARGCGMSQGPRWGKGGHRGQGMGQGARW